jgi:phosphomevalonate kinase
LAQRFAVTYKTSGAGGGDLGIAMSRDSAALAALRAAVAEEGFLWVDLRIDPNGLMVEELTE